MEHWHKTYTSDVDIYEAFAAAFDPEGLVWHCVLETVPFEDNSPEMIEAVRTELEPTYVS